ncbi:MAG: sulfotransferase [Xenococcaceae cyanobacterium MO_188.B29]|nr:sulfotransferase [Xenococcaceae cyanobacterium MO_188.B29]
MPTKQLDFIIIGAMKAGTTSMYKYLQNHPEIYMLPEKESPFFSSDSRFEKGWEDYAKDYFQDAPINKIWGKASPTYMPDLRVPQRICEVMPNVKLIAILRNPIDRVFSHYQHLLRLGYEKREFSKLVEEEIKEDVFKKTRLLPGNLAVYNSYIAMGEYGRIIKAYLEFIPKEQLLILFTDELESNPRKTIKNVFDFLGVDNNFIPKNIDKRYHVGGRKKIIPIEHTDITNFLDRIEKNFFFHRIPRTSKLFNLKIKYNKIKRNYVLWFRIWNIRAEKEKPQIPTKIRISLQQTYQKDVELLSQIIDKKIPWMDFKL